MGLRRTETSKLDLADWGRNPAAPEFGRFGMLHVRYGKAKRGQPPRRRNVASVILGDTGASRWLFPGGQADRPIGPSSLAGRLHKIGIYPARDRSIALFQLATELPAAVLARTLGIHVKVAVEWQHASAGDWGSYAADVSRRTRPVPLRHETPART